MTRFRLRLLAPLAVLAAAGCSDPPIGTLKGTVTLNGSPVSSGAIFLYPVNQDTRTASCMITPAGYEVQLPPTTYRVVISSPQSAGSTSASYSPTTDDGPAVKETIPPEYNEKSELRVTVLAGPNEMNFDLTGKAK